jgi:ABC-type oligopeptide transport system substrate-binding subunit
MSDRFETKGEIVPGTLGHERLTLLEKRLGRRALLGGAAGMTAAAFLAACGASDVPATAPAVATALSSAAPRAATTVASAAPAVATTVASVAPTAAAVATSVAGGGAPTASSGASAAPAASSAALPADAAAADQQVYVVTTSNEAKVLDFYEAVYARPAIADLFSDPLVRLSKDNTIVPGAALSWKGSDDGKTWTFNLDKDLVWSDGNPVTADDYVATLQYGADPKHAWDFTWYFQGILTGWDDAIAGKIPLDQIGAKRGGDANTLVLTTQLPAPYLPAMLLYSWPLSKAALAKSGPLYNTKPETAVSAGPFILQQWVKDQQIVYTRNTKYKGKMTPALTKIILKIADQKTDFTAYQNGEIDYTATLAPADIKVATSDPTISKEIHPSFQDFRTTYLFFDVTQAPFDNIKVRQAISHVIDRDAIQKAILGPAGSPAYSWLAPGFPAANGPALKDIQKYDLAAAKQLLVDAGFPNGQGFPKQTMWLRNASALDQAVANAIASSMKQNLGIDVEVSNKDTKLFMDNLTAKPTKILFGYLSYGMDFVDPYNMLSVWLSGGRHSWNNKEFDTKVKEAASFTGATDQRIKMFQDAEKILVSDVPGAFIYHTTQVQLLKPYVKGEALEPDKNGNASIHWPNYTTASLVPNGLYMTKDVSKRKA